MSKVVAVIVTWRRERELERLLASLERSSFPLDGCVVMDHAGTGPESFARRSFPVRIVQDTTNPGPGAGWANGARIAGEVFGKPDVWYLDDDVVAPPGTLEILLREKKTAVAICPLLEDDEGRLWGFPEPVSKPARKTNREATAHGRRWLYSNRPWSRSECRTQFCATETPCPESGDSSRSGAEPAEKNGFRDERFRRLPSVSPTRTGEGPVLFREVPMEAVDLRIPRG